MAKLTLFLASNGCLAIYGSKVAGEKVCSIHLMRAVE